LALAPRHRSRGRVSGRDFLSVGSAHQEDQRRASLPMVVIALIRLQAVAQDTTHYTHADTLSGSNGPARARWDVQFYDLHTRVNPRDSSISGWNGITYRVLQPPPAR